jgi:hypothetical protein
MKVFITTVAPSGGSGDIMESVSMRYGQIEFALSRRTQRAVR